MNKPAKREKQPPAIKDKQIMLNKYGLSVGAAYTEQCTLLEPNNFIPSWEAGDEEKKEVSNALRNLREKYDGIRRLRNEKERALDQLNVSQLDRRRRASFARSPRLVLVLQQLFLLLAERCSQSSARAQHSLKRHGRWVG